MPTAATTPMGVAPMAATSLRLTATLIQPMSSPVISRGKIRHPVQHIRGDHQIVATDIQHCAVVSHIFRSQYLRNAPDDADLADLVRFHGFLTSKSLEPFKAASSLPSIC